MKTVVITIEKPSKKGDDYPVQLQVDDGSPDWLQKKPLASSTIREDLSIESPPLDPLDGKTPLEGGKLREIFLEETESSERFEAIGEYLYQLLFQGSVGVKWDDLRKKYPKEEGASEGRRTFLDIKPKSLRQLPWELMTSSSLPLFLDPLNPIVRGSLSLAEQPDFMWPLHVLIVVGSEELESASGNKIRAMDEVSTVEDALMRFGKPVEWDVLEGKSNQELVATLDAFQPHILHFIGHGRKSITGNYPVLAFEGGENVTEWEWSAKKIILDLRGSWTPRFVFLNACRSSDEQESEKVWGITEAFIEAGVPAVVGMQADVQGDAAASFPGKLYEALTLDHPLDVALAQARSNVSRISRDGLERRDWALATFSLSVLPDQVVNMHPPVTDKFKLAIEGQFSVISDFVDRVKPRRTLWHGVEPLPKSGTAKNLLIVKGTQSAGKTWLAYWCLRTSAWRERNIMYVSLGRPGTKDFLEVLRLIRDACVLGKPIGRPVAPNAFSEFNLVVNYTLDPKEPEPGSFPANAVAKDKELPFRQDIDNDSIERILGAFKAALQKAAGDQVLIIALDDLLIRKDHFKNYLVPYLIQPVATGQEETLKNVRMMLVGTDEEYEEFELSAFENISVTVRLELLGRDELDFFSRELCVLKGMSKAKMEAFLKFVTAANPASVKPDDIRQLFKIYQNLI